MKKETENKQQSFSFKKGHTLPMSDENLDFLENCQKALLIGNLRGMIVDNNDDGKPSFFQTTNICDKKAKMALTFYKRFSDVNKFTHFLVHEDDLRYYKDFIENFALETGQVFTHRLRGKSTEYKIAFIPPIVDSNVKGSINIGDGYRKDLETLSSFAVGSEEQDKQIKYMLQKYVAICLNYTDGKLNEVYTDHGNITVIVYKDNKMFTNVYYKVNKVTGEKIEIRDFDNVPKMFNDRINRFKGKKTMTYDFILMNPPYDKNLHLKIVEQSIPMLTDDGILVNLSPIRWLQDPLAKYKKSSDWYKFKEVRERIEDIVEVPMVDACDMFDAGFNSDLGIYYITNNGGWKNNINTTKSFVDKILQKATDKSIMDIATKECWRGEYKGIFGVINSHYGDIEHFIKNDYKLFCKGRYTNTNKVLFFDTEQERQAMFSYLSSKLMDAFAREVRVNQRVPWQFVPVLPDYTHPWTDEQLYDYFNLTPEEVKEIEELM